MSTRPSLHRPWRRRWSTRAAPIDLFMRMRTYLFNELAFLGNRNDYYNPDNSFMHKVIEYRRGIPITLSVLMMLVG